MEIENIIYKYLRGSWCHGIAVEGKSDYDYGGVYYCDIDELLGVRSKYREQISDSKCDEVYYEIGRWIELLLKSNPTVLESLFIDKEFIIGEVHPVIQKIIDNREMFLSKKAFAPLIGYSYEQIKKATGYKKKRSYPEDMERRNILDFCYIPYEQGSKKIVNWLEEYGMKQKYCGLVDIPNMYNTYGVYYDWGTHFICEFGVNLKDINSVNSIGDRIIDDAPYKGLRKGMDKFLKAFDHLNGIWYYLQEELYNSEPYGFSGIVSENSDSNEIRTCKIPKNIKPITYMMYNRNGYETHCREYREWAEWKKNRNPIRYSDNRGYNFDAKNMCETVRLIHTGIELAKGEGFNVKRTWDRDFLLDIKNHKLSYNEIKEYVTGKKNEFDELVKISTLPENLDYERINQLLIDVRKEFYNI